MRDNGGENRLLTLYSPFVDPLNENSTKGLYIGHLKT